jgi:plastocyanin
MRTFAFVCALALVACGSKGREPQLHEVAIRGMQFEPAIVEVHVGDTIVWTNEDIVPHTATATGLFDSASIAAKQQWRYTIAAARDIAYVCTFHPTMRATIIVR